VENILLFIATSVLRNTAAYDYGNERVIKRCKLKFKPGTLAVYYTHERCNINNVMNYPVGEIILEHN
jgi:hypothetical protein